MKLNTVIIGGFILAVLIISTFAFISAFIDNQKNLEIFENHIKAHGEIQDDEFLQIKRDVNSKLITILIIFTVISLILSILFGIFINFLIGKPIQRISKSIEEISKGNFEVEIDTKTGIKEINYLAESLNRVLASMKLAVLRKGSVKKGNFDREKTGISEKDLAKSGLLSNSKPEPKIEITKKPISKSIAVIKEADKIKKPLVTFPNKKLIDKKNQKKEVEDKDKKEVEDKN